MNDKQTQLAENMARQKTLTETAANENRAMSYGEQAEYDALQRDIDALISEIAAGQSAQRTQPDSAVPDTQPPAAAPDEPQTDGVQRAIEAERRRVADITALCRQFEVDPSEHIREGRDMNQVRALILDKLAREHPPIGSGVRVEDTGENDFRRDAADGLLIRGGVTVQNPTDGARKFSVLSLRDLAIDCLTREGSSDARHLDSSALFTEVCTRQTVKNAGFNNHVRITNATPSRLYALLKVNGRTLTQPRFHTTRNTKKRGARTEVIRGHGLKELVNREGNKAFFAKVATGNKNVVHEVSAQDKTTNMVLQREGDDRYPMRSFHGSSVPKMLEKVYDGRSITAPGLKREIEEMYRQNVDDAIGKALSQ